MIPIENWARVSGRVESVTDAEVEDHLAVTIVLDAVEPVDEYPNRLHRTPGDELTVLVRRTSVDDVVPGAVLRARVRRASLERVYAHPEEVVVDAPE